jgi:hypothetical protein
MFEVLGKAILLSTVQLAIANIELGSRSDSKHKDLRRFLWVAAIWALGCVLLLYGQKGTEGAVLALLANALVIGYIYTSYKNVNLLSYIA